MKPLGGLYLLYLAYSQFASRSSSEEEDVDKQKSWLYRSTLGCWARSGPPWP
ncbi:hypothetical protein MUN84_04845 [Hymenobacter sp. 5516J-16]|uniref:hypothetical protein n=1 Tax=Hymenobacter sp. 5516J-16 TaxID=2932253 RepID=UPI001FCF8457|nr:hypothetical protein [Hymenobacter sp. 5516J-16]UOQ77965.1 hypothetical protein MUN84_04845 [Hymenobacter sp. 5516J-16]